MIRVAIGLLFVGGAGLAKSTVAAGTVVDGTGAALPGAHVRLERPPVIKQTVTDALGNFSIEGLQEGQWNVTITKPGWEPARRSIDLLEGAPVSLNVQMEPEVLRQAIDVTESAGYLVQTAESSTKMDIALRDLPQAVQVLPSQLLKEQAALSMQDALRNASGVSVHMGEGRRDQVYVRGFSAVNDQYVDGIRDDAPYYRDLSNIEQIEVLKGPGSVLFGRGSSGGIINRTTKRPNPERPIMEAGVTIGSYGTKRVTGDLGRAQWDGKLAWRLTGAGEESGSHRDRYYLNRYTFAPSVAWTPDQATQLLFQGEHLNDERLPDRGIPSFEGRPAPVRVGAYYGAPIGDALRNRVTAGGFTLSHRFTESVSLRNTFRRIGYANTYSNTYPNDVQAIGGVPMVNRGQYNVSQDQENYFNQTDLLAHFSLLGFAHNVLIGMEAGDQDRRTWRFTGSVDPVALFNPVLTEPVYSAVPATANRFDGGTLGVYFQDQIQVASRWKVMVGARRDRFSQTLIDVRSTNRLSRLDGVWSPRAGIVYQPTYWTSFYSSVSRSFQPSGDGLSLAVSSADLQPETTINYEVGNKSEFLGSRIQVTTALFHLQRNNVRTVDPVDFNRLILAGRQRTQGVEISVAGEILRNWNVYGGYAWLDSRILKSNDLAGGVPIQGKRLGHIPLHSANLWSTYNFGSGFGLGAGVTYAADRFTANDNLVVMPGYVRIDAALFWRAQHYEASLNLRNLTNGTYYETAHGTYTIMPGAPANGLLTMRYRW